LYNSLHTDHEGGNVSAHTTHLVGSALSSESPNPIWLAKLNDRSLDLSIAGTDESWPLR
jgi:hypothetical protein